jgi:predicted neuraminidase
MVPPYETNHASFIELLPNGDLLLSWFSGKKEGYSGVAIVLSRLKNGSDQWTNAAVVAKRDGYSNQNPVLFYDSQGKMVHLYYAQNPGKKALSGVEEPSHSPASTVWKMNSTDLGSNWSVPVVLFNKDGAWDRNRMLTTLNGQWIMPMYYSGDQEYCATQITPDWKNWTSYPMKDTTHLDQPSVIRPKPGNATLFSYYRDRERKHIYVASSLDDGKEWSAPEKTQFPNNNAGIQAYTLANQHIVLVYNPTTHGRHPIRISLSEDGGKTWPYYRDLESGDGPEYSYPCILQTPDEYIHVTYTFNRKTIKYVKFMVDWIKKKL